ncbi:MAG: PIG-L deacetylase family protein [Acidobacteriota bacterium]
MFCLLLAVAPAAAQDLRYFPHVADGTGSGIRFLTSLTLVNTGGEAEIHLDVFDEDGQPLALTLPELGGTASSFTLQLLPGQVLSAATPGSGGLKVGYMSLTAPESVEGTAVYTGIDSKTDTILFEAGVPAVHPTWGLTVLLDSMGNRDTGVAIVALPASGASAGPAEADSNLIVSLYDETGNLLATRQIVLPSGHKFASFVHELFAEQPATAQRAREMRGSLSVASESLPLAAVTLRQVVPDEAFPDAVPTLTTYPVANVAISDREAGQERVMVFAPHPDDEALGCAGMLRRALQRGDRVRVVVATCGDAFQSAKEALEQSMPALAYDRDGDDDFDLIDYGILRHGETLAAMSALGVDPSDVIFLGYPDAGLDDLWSSTETYRSAFTAASSVPPSYSFAYRVGAPYNRDSLLSDIRNVIQGFNPTTIYSTTDTDTHQDHWALAKFVRQALLDLPFLRSRRAHYGYLIHWEAHEAGWPHGGLIWTSPGGHAPPDLDIFLSDFGYTSAEKRSVIDLYVSQTLTGGTYLRSFAKEDEIFWLESRIP